MIRRASIAALVAVGVLTGCTSADGSIDWPRTGALALVGAGGVGLGIAAAGTIGGATAGSGLATAAAVNADANTALAAVRPLNQALCLARPWKPQSDEAKAAVAAFCANLPTNTAGLLAQGEAVIAAIDAAKAAAAAKEPTP